jgi:S1-C subfamily serine protease
MVPSNVLQRTYRIAFGTNAGTGFTVDHLGRQYMVTAKHVVAGLKTGDELRVANAGNWLSVPVTLIGHAVDPVDISVLALPVPLSPRHELLATSKEAFVGQDMYLVGFPFGLHSTTTEDLNANYPIAFVKRGILSAFGNDNGFEVIYLDALNNPGFSGGPVVYRRHSDAAYCVASVISGYRTNDEPVYDAVRDTGYTVRVNTGIVISWPTRYAIEMIERDPNGLQV